MSTQTESAPDAPAPSQQQAPASTEAEDARYASQAAAGQSAPVAFEGGATPPGGPSGGPSGGTTGRGEWTFLTLTVLFSLVLVTVPAIFFTSIDLTDVEDAGEPAAPAGREEAREIERLQLLQETRAEALSKLYTYGPAETAERYRIPVERAMRLTWREGYATPPEAAQTGPVVVPADSAAEPR